MCRAPTPWAWSWRSASRMVVRSVMPVSSTRLRSGTGTRSVLVRSMRSRIARPTRRTDTRDRCPGNSVHNRLRAAATRGQHLGVAAGDRGEGGVVEDGPVPDVEDPAAMAGAGFGHGVRVRRQDLPPGGVGGVAGPQQRAGGDRLVGRTAVVVTAEGWAYAVAQVAFPPFRQRRQGPWTRERAPRRLA